MELAKIWPLRPSFRGDAKHRTRNLEIPGLVRSLSSGAHSRDPLGPSRNDAEYQKGFILQSVSRGFLATAPPAHDFVRSPLPFARLPSHICLKPARSTRWHRRRSALRNLNAIGGKPNEDAVSAPLRAVSAG